MPKRRVVLAFTIAAAAVTTGCATRPAPASVADTIAATASLSTLDGLLARAGLSDVLESAGPYTVFAPTNDAFKAVAAKTLDEVSREPARLKALLGYHIVPGRLLSTDVNTTSVKTLNGANLSMSKAGGFVTVEDALVQTPDVAATNGVVQVIDRVLLPPKP